MKSLTSIVVFVILCLGLFPISFSFVKAQCPPGWNYVSMPFGPDPNGCAWTVEFCYKCGITGGSPANLKVIAVKPINPFNSPCTLPTADNLWLIPQLQIIYNNMCTVPPCSEGCRTFVLEMPICYQWVTYGWQNPDNSFHYSSWKQPCPTGDYCLISWKSCLDFDPPPPENGEIVPCSIDPGPGYTLVPKVCNQSSLSENPPGTPNIDFVGIRFRTECHKLYECP